MIEAPQLRFDEAPVRRFAPYPAYRDSGIEWLGEIPVGWEVKALKRLASLRAGSAITADSIEEAGEYPVFGGNGIRGFASSYTHVGDFPLIGRQGALCGCVNFASGRFWASEHAVVAAPQADVHPYWLAHLLGAMSLNSYSESAAQPGLAIDPISALRVPAPGFSEQRAIAAFLDRETARIDALVAKKDRLIELLQEQRAALITRAVTNGLDPNVPMKNSGAEWLGAIPAHWSTRQGRFLYRALELPPQEGDGVVTAYRDGQVTLRERRRAEGYTFAIQEIGYQRVRSGDLVIQGMDAFAGAIGVSDSTGKCSPEYLVLDPVIPGTDNRYFAAALRLMAKRGYILVVCNAVRERAPRFRVPEFRNVLLPQPPILEQRAIASYLDRETAKIDALIAKVGDAVERLKELRTALISAAVTGKIDVRGEIA